MRNLFRKLWLLWYKRYGVYRQPKRKIKTIELTPVPHNPTVKWSDIINSSDENK